MKHLRHIGFVFVAVFTLVRSGHAVPKGGDVDLSFDPGSTVNGTVYSVAVQANGQVIIAGDFTQVHRAVRGRVARLNADGTTDFSFMNGLSGADVTVNAVAIQSDGKILLGGRFEKVNGVNHFAIARLNADGSLDPGFRNGMTGFDNSSSILCLRVQSDGKILVAGYFASINGLTRNSIARLNADGSPDTSFQNGMSGVLGSFGENTVVHSMVLQPDGKVIIDSDHHYVNGVLCNGIARLNSDGSLDAGFQVGGFGFNGSIQSLALQPDGKVIAGGQFDGINGTARGRIARLNANGSLDTTFQNGMTGVSGDYGGYIVSVANQPDGKILIGGAFTSVNGVAHTNIARLNSDGSLDSSFQAMPQAIEAIALQSNGQVFIGGGLFLFNGTIRHNIARLNSDGTLDTGFQNGTPGVNATVSTVALQPDGKVLIDGFRLNADGSRDESFQNRIDGGDVQAMVLQPDGRLLVGGNFTSVNGTNRNRIARLNPNGSLDPTFQNGMSGVSPGYASVHLLALQPDGKVVIGGFFDTVNGATRNCIARLNSDGSLDNGFQNGLDGLGVDYGGPDLTAMALQPEGKLLISGHFSYMNGIARTNIARLNADGSLDTGFQIDIAGPANSIVLEPDGKVIIGGAGLARLNTDDSLDPAFANGLANIFVNSVICQPDGKIIIGGNASLAGIITNTIIRLNSDGSLDTSFENGMSGPDASPRSILLQPDGKILIAGGFNTVNGLLVPYLARLYGSEPRPFLGNFAIVSREFGFSISGFSNQVVIVEDSTNLLNWIPLATNTLGDAPFPFSDPASPNFPNRFYRTRSQ